MQQRSFWAAASLMLAGTSLFAQQQFPTEPSVGPPRLAAVGDPALSDLVQTALEQHPQVLAAAAGLDRRQALARAASRPLFNPELELELERSDADDKIVRLSQTLDVRGRRDARTRVAERRLDAAEELVAISRRDLALELLSTLGAFWTATELAALADQRLELLQRVAEITAQRARVGDATQADLNLASLARVQARMERARTAADLAAAEQTLQALVPAAQARDWPALPVALPAVEMGRDALAALVDEIPEVALRRQALRVAAAEVDLRERERRPNPSVSLIGGEEENESLIGLGFSMPLNVRNRFVYEVEAARAEERRAEREVDDAALRAFAAAQAATVSYALVRGAWADWLESGEINLTQQTELLERLWRAGELNLTDYLVQLNQTLDTQRSALELRRQLWTAWFDWLAATGQIGAWLDLPVEN